MEKDGGISLEWRRFDDMPAALLYEILRFRQGIFVVEQASPYADLDGRDEASLHLLLRIDGALTGYLRLTPGERRNRIGRVAVGASHRGEGLARRMMESAFALQRRDYPDSAIAISAQSYLIPFYANLGFRPTSDEYDDFGVPHIDMLRQP